MTQGLRAAEPPWSSTVPAADLGALEDLGFTPCGFVLGTSVVLYGFGSVGSGGGMRMGGLTLGMSGSWGAFGTSRLGGAGDTMHVAWRDAVSRLVVDAHNRGAHGVIALHVEMRPAADGAALELILAGTAVRRHGTPLPETPFTTKANARDLTKLLTAGYAPTHLAMGFSAVQAASYFTSIQLGSWNNTEVTSLSSAGQQSRDRALAELTTTAAQTGAGEVIGVELHPNVHEYEANNQTYFVVSTLAVGSGMWRTGVREEAKRPLTIMRLRDKP